MCAGFVLCLYAFAHKQATRVGLSAAATGTVMEALETLDYVLHIINDYVLLQILGIAFSIQVFYILLFFVKAKTYPKAKTQHRFGIVIPARNEADVIADTIKCILKSDYPRDLFDVYVVADNCTDNTAEIARAAGAIVYERSDPDPKHHRAGYALKYLFEKIRENHAGYEAFIKLTRTTSWSPITFRA